MNTGRTYAAFRDEQLSPLLDSLGDHKEILDPMAGYGCLMTSCARSLHSLRSYNIECNPPSYFWQLLINPGNSERLGYLADAVLSQKCRWPTTRLSVDASESWFPESSLNLLRKLWCLCLDASSGIFVRPSQMTLAFLLPFVGRLGSFVQGNVVTQVKPGGICVYSGWRDDFEEYIQALKRLLDGERQDCRQSRHTVLLADARTWKSGRKRFSAMITSPPYPNGRDYSRIFAIENAFIEWMVGSRMIDDVSLKTRLIGCPVVAEEDGYTKKRRQDVKSPIARKFLAFLESYSESRRAVEDNRVYYVPYYSNYFHDLELAYENVAKSLSSTFEGYIIAVNNTARRRVIPVAQTVVQIWRRLGFDARIKSTEELTHVGGMNPKVKGFTSRHTEYTIRVSR